MSNSPSVLLIDDGELDDVNRLLGELRADTVRVCGAEEGAPLPFPSRLLVATARRALALGDAHRERAHGFTAIAVANSDAKTLRTALRRIGFDYLVRRPVHPEALRLLLLRALYSDRERRSEPRLPLGYQVTWRTNWRLRRATLVEISPRGCRLLASHQVPRAMPVRVHLPRALAGGLGFSIPGRVVRSRKRRSSDPRSAVVLAVEFDELRPAARARLGTLLTELEMGPATLPESSAPPSQPHAEEEDAPTAAAAQPSVARTAAAARVPPQAATATPPQTSPQTEDLWPDVAAPQAKRSPEAETPAPIEDSSEPVALLLENQRRHRRSSFSQEVMALDERAERVVHVLSGCDLSASGLRVEPHQSLELGDRLRLALYDASSPDPIVVEAEVVRENRKYGLALSFVNVAPAVAQTIEAIVDRLGSVEPLQPESSDSQGVVMAEILPDD